MNCQGRGPDPRLSLRRAVAIPVLVAVVACGGEASKPPGPPDSVPTPANQVGRPGSVRTPIEAWLFCDDCERGERDSVRRLGDGAVAQLDSVLTRIPQQWEDNLTARYGQSARRINLTGGDSARYVKRYLANFTATVQSRVGQVLGDIKTPQAIAALRAALGDSVNRSYRTDVIRDLRGALVAATTQRLTGAVRPQEGGFLDTVWVTGAGWDRNDSVNLEGAPFPRDVTVGIRADTLLGFVLAGLPGYYTFSIGKGGGAPTQHAEVRITTFPDTAVARVIDLSARPFPMTILQSLSRTISPPDQVHQFRFQPAADLRVTATADWAGPPLISLVWDDCANRPTPVSNPGKVAGRVLDVLGNTAAGVRVQLLGIRMETLTRADGSFEISGVQPGWAGTLTASFIGFQPSRLEAWEGAAGIMIVLRPDSTAIVSQSSSGPSPRSASIGIPRGSCRLLTVVRSDTATDPAIVRLRVTSP